MPVKKRDTFISPQLVGKVLILVLALLIVAGIGIGTAIATHGSSTKPSSSTAHNTSTPLQNTPLSGPIEQAPKAGSVEVHVTLAEYSIVSSVKVFHAGTTYYFVVTNRGHDIHELTILPDKPDGTPLPPAVQFKGTLFEIEPIMPGTTWTINYTFSPTSAGGYEMACQMDHHYQAGMRLPIVVAG